MIFPNTVSVFYCGVVLSLMPLQGATVIDQQVKYSGNFFLGLPLRMDNSLGQSFTPSLSSIQFITINALGSMDNTPVQTTLRIRLFLGEDRSTDAIALSPDIVVRSRTVELPAGEFTLVSHVVDPVTWLFDSPVSLDPGIRYSFYIDHISGDDLWWSAPLESSYAGGRALFTSPFGDVENESMSFSFSEGVLIPEPGSFFMMGGAALIFSILRRRRIEVADVVRCRPHPH